MLYYNIKIVNVNLINLNTFLQLFLICSFYSHFMQKHRLFIPSCGLKNHLYVSSVFILDPMVKKNMGQSYNLVWPMSHVLIFQYLFVDFLELCRSRHIIHIRIEVRLTQFVAHPSHDSKDEHESRQRQEEICPFLFHHQ